jgi:hypothetical protein
VQFQHRKRVRLFGDRVLNDLRVFVERFLSAGNDLRDNREAIAGGSLGENRAVAALLRGSRVKSSLGDGHGGRL